jgi:hypothetical protein
MQAHGAMAADLAAFQATAPVAASHELSDVLQAMAPAFARGFAYSCKLQQSDDARHLEVLLMHRGGWDVSSSITLAAADTADPFAAAGLLLAGLLGIRVNAAVATAQRQPEVCEELPEVCEELPEVCEELQALIEQADQASDADDDAADLIGEGSPDHQVPAEQLVDLSKADHDTCVAMIKALPSDARKQFTVAFRSHFNVDQSERTISKLITQVQHKLFIQGFLDELELQEAA